MEYADTVMSGLPQRPDTPDAALTATANRQIPIAFTGSGSEYFRIWIVNMLLTLVTLGLYFPWAKARRLRYFMGNTLVGGQPLGFHGDPKKMFKGYVLVGILFALYSVAGEFSSTAGLLALVLVAGLWPALFKSSLQFRLANTSWRGLRFRFTGDLSAAYRAVLPLFLPGLLLVGGLTFVNDESAPPAWFGFLALGVMLTTLATAPWLMWNLKQYQHNHYSLGYLQTSFRATVGSFYLLSLKILGVGLLATLLPVALTIGTLFGLDVIDQLREDRGTWMMTIAILPALLGFLVALMVIKPYAVARLQNMVWTKTGNTELRFVSQLHVGPLLWITVKNWVLIIITLGLYWPFAAIALARVRLESVSIKSRVNPDLLVSRVRPREGDAAGDAAGDFFGLDVGL